MEVLPAKSSAVIVRSYVLSTKLRVNENLPSLSALTSDPNGVPPLKSFTVDPASVVPVIVGVALVVKVLITEVIVIVGAVVSIVSVKTAEEEEMLPAASVAVAVNV